MDRLAYICRRCCSRCRSYPGADRQKKIVWQPANGYFCRQKERMPELFNDQLQIVIAEKGAELQHIIRKDSQLEYLWNADPAFWAKKSPVLFPIVGTLKNNTYTYKGKNYTLGRHGFARDHVFTIEEQTNTRVVFTLTDTEHTLPVYPFNFKFSVVYTLDGD